MPKTPFNTFLQTLPTYFSTDQIKGEYEKLIKLVPKKTDWESCFFPIPDTAHYACLSCAMKIVRNKYKYSNPKAMKIIDWLILHACSCSGNPVYCLNSTFYDKAKDVLNK